MQLTIKVDGAEELSKALKEKVKLTDVKRVVRHNGQQLHQGMTRNANFVKGYQTGATKRSIQLKLEELSATVKPTTEYAPYLEWGTRFMGAQPFVGPAFHVQKEKFIRDLKKLMR